MLARWWTTPRYAAVIGRCPCPRSRSGRPGWRAGSRVSGWGTGIATRSSCATRSPFSRRRWPARQIGAVPVPVNWHWTGEDLAYLLQDSGSKLAFVSHRSLPRRGGRAPRRHGTIVEVARCPTTSPPHTGNRRGRTDRALPRTSRQVIAENDPRHRPGYRTRPRGDLHLRHHRTAEGDSAAAGFT